STSSALLRVAGTLVATKQLALRVASAARAASWMLTVPDTVQTCSGAVRESLQPPPCSPGNCHMIGISKAAAWYLDSLRSDSGDDEIEHAVDPIRVGRMLVHHDNSVDQPYHVANMHIWSDLHCGLGTVQEDFSSPMHRDVRGIAACTRNLLGS